MVEQGLSATTNLKFPMEAAHWTRDRTLEAANRLLGPMALPALLRLSPSPHELEYIAYNSNVEIVPLFSMEKIRLLQGVFGPFRPPNKTLVPLWFAVNLKLKKKCHIVPPEWLSVG